MAALVATKKAPWAEALVLQAPPAQSPVGPSQLKLRVLAAGLAFPDVLSIEGSHGRWTPVAWLATTKLLQRSLWPPLLTASTDSPMHRAAGLRVLRTVGQREYPFIPGMEVSGEVIEIGSAVADYSIGDRVFGAPLDGAFKPECLVDAKSVHRIPPGVDPNVCAGFELNYGTAVRELSCTIGQAFACCSRCSV